MADDTKGSGLTAVGDRIASAAVAVALATRNAKYTSPPVSDHAFDCSYFVWLVLKKLNPLFTRESSGQIATDRLRFQVVSGTPQPGDIVFFPPSVVQFEVKRGDKRVYPGHVAIMLNANIFVGMQSSGPGPQQVDLGNLWWQSRPHRFFRYIGPVSGG